MNKIKLVVEYFIRVPNLLGILSKTLFPKLFYSKCSQCLLLNIIY